MAESQRGEAASKQWSVSCSRCAQLIPTTVAEVSLATCGQGSNESTLPCRAIFIIILMFTRFFINETTRSRHANALLLLRLYIWGLLQLCMIMQKMLTTVSLLLG